MKKSVLKNFSKFTAKYLCKSLAFATLLKKETLAQVFSCELYEIFKEHFFNRTHPSDCFCLVKSFSHILLLQTNFLTLFLSLH